MDGAFHLLNNQGLKAIIFIYLFIYYIMDLIHMAAILFCFTTLNLGVKNLRARPDR